MLGILGVCMNPRPLERTRSEVGSVDQWLLKLVMHLLLTLLDIELSSCCWVFNFV